MMSTRLMLRMNCGECPDDYVEVGPMRDPTDTNDFSIKVCAGEEEVWTIHSREKLLDFAKKIIATYGDKASGPYR